MKGLFVTSFGASFRGYLALKNGFRCEDVAEDSGGCKRRPRQEENSRNEQVWD
jgi:hypothetical protein